MDYDFSIEALLKEAFHRTDGVKLVFLAAIVIYVIVSVIVRGILDLFLVGINPNIVSFVEMLFTLPMMVSLMMFGLKRARGIEIKIPSLFEYYGMIFVLSLAYILVSMLTMLGYVLLIIPGLYLTISYAFVYVLIVDKGLGVWEAMELSRKVVTKKWFKFFALALVIAVIIVVSALPLGIGLFWTIPMSYISYGLLYHRLFDDEEI